MQALGTFSNLLPLSHAQVSWSAFVLKPTMKEVSDEVT
jgi:hypothetical protein